MAQEAPAKPADLLLEPLQVTFARLAIRSAYRAPAVGQLRKA